MTAATLRLALSFFLFAQFLLAMLYLRRRQLQPRAFLFWGLLALLLPLLGPFLVIALRPGFPRRPPLAPRR
jgi:hypothetical protein